MASLATDCKETGNQEKTFAGSHRIAGPKQETGDEIRAHANRKPAQMKSVKLDGKAIHPSKIVCIGRNYVDHIRELGNDIPAEMVFFIKPNSAMKSIMKLRYLSSSWAGNWLQWVLVLT